MHYAEACNEFAVPISASLRQGNAVFLEEMLLRWRAVENTVFDLIGLRFKSQTSCSIDERVTARPTRRLVHSHFVNYTILIIVFEIVQ